MHAKYTLPLWCAIALVLSPATVAPAAGPDGAAEAVSSYLDNQTFLVARLDVEKVPLSELSDRVIKFLGELTDDPDIEQGVITASTQLSALRSGFLQAGGKDVYLILSMSDFPFQTPFFVVTSSAPDKLPVLEKMVSQLTVGPRPALPKIRVRRTADNRLLIGSASTLDRVETLKAPPRPAFAAAWKAASDAPLHVVLAPSPDQHRVLLETFPQFPRPWEQLNGQVLSEGIQWAVLSINGSPKLQAELIVESKNKAAAEKLSALATSSLEKLAEFPEIKRVVPNARNIFAFIQPQVTDSQVRVTLTEDAKTVDAVMKPLAVAITAARASAKRAQSMNNLKQIGLAMHIYHDKHKKFPAAASYDANGKPLLSWRVHLLPYLDQKALYDQFKLDEPWDSEHNKELAEQVIPAPYRDPMQNVKGSMTTYMVPVGEGTIFGNKEGLSLRDIRDGSSNTLLVVSVAAENAVLWSKPDDLAVSKTDPKKGLFSQSRDIFLGALADGSVRAFARSIDSTMLWRLLQANDRQSVDWGKVK